METHVNPEKKGHNHHHRQHHKSSNEQLRELNRIFSKYAVTSKEDIAKFTIGKTHKYSIDRTYINLYYDNDRIIFQTPLLFVPYGPRLVDSWSSLAETYQLDASFFNNQYDADVTAFETWINGLESVVLKLLKKRAYLGLDRSGLVSLLKRDEYRHCNKLTLKIDTKLSNFYMLEKQNKLGERVNFRELRVPCYAVFIAEVSTIWVKRTITELDTVVQSEGAPTNVWGLGLTIHAAQCVYSHVHARTIAPDSQLTFVPNPGLSMALAEQPDTNTLAEYQPPEHLAKYTKMLKLGIPKDAVKHKMSLDGLDPGLLDFKPPPPPPPGLGFIPPPPPMPIPGANASASGPVKITTDMLASVKLKTSTQTTPTKQHKPANMGFKIDLNDILNIKAKLKKRDPSSEPDSYSKMFGSSSA